MRGEPQRVAVLGLGSIGAAHIQALERLPDVEVIAVPARDRRVAEYRRTAPTLADAAAEGATACIVATNTGRHVEDVMAALELGLNVLVEKPLGVDAAEATPLVARAARAGRVVSVGYVLRFSTALNHFRDRLAELGRIHAVRIECQSYLPEWRPGRPFRESYSASAREGGVLRDLSHEIDYAGWLFGWPAAVQARVRNEGRLGIAADESADLLWEARDGCVVSMRLDYLTRPGHRRMIAAGERGTLEWDGIAGQVVQRLVDVPVWSEVRPQTREDRLLNEHKAFLDGDDPRLATLTDGLNSLAVCDAARWASLSGRTEVVEVVN